MPAKGFFFFLLFLVGLGVGAIHEIAEFIITVIMPETGVGDYEHTMLDLMFNSLGAIAAATISSQKEQTLNIAS